MIRNLSNIAINFFGRRINIFIPVLAFICCGLSLDLYAESAPELYRTASTFYKEKEYEKSAEAYEKIVTQGYRSSAVYYNLGNCYYKLNNTGRAILNFERAHNLAPDDEDITHNLKIAQSKTVDKLMPVPQLAIATAMRDFTCSQTSKQWGIFAVSLIWITLIVFALYLFVSRKGFVLWIGVLLLFFSMSAVALGFKQNMAEENSNTAILIVSNVNAKSAPDVNGTDLFTIHEGIKFQILDKVGTWNKIRLADGKVGWIEKHLFEKI